MDLKRTGATHPADSGVQGRGKTSGGGDGRDFQSLQAPWETSDNSQHLDGRSGTGTAER